MTLTADDILAQVEKYHLLPDKDLATVRAKWFVPERADAHDGARLCDGLRANHVISDFVLAALAQGRAERLILNKYRLIDRLRHGPEAGDYLAVDPFDRLVHIQIIAPAVAHDLNLFSRFREVAQRAMNVRHPNVPRILDLGHTPEVDYLVSDHIEGESLAEVLKKRGKLALDLAVRMFVMAFDGLEALHHGEVWAGELTAGCLVVTSGDRPGGRTIRLANFAFPKRLFDSSSLDLGNGPPAARPSSPPAGENLLPEGPASPEDDIARLGAVLYRCVTGLEATVGDSPMKVHQVAPEVPIDLADLIDRLVDPDPEFRPGLPGAVAEE